MDAKTKKLLKAYAAKYERASFIEGDPSWFMHQVKGALNQEATAFIAQSLSFGSRALFLPKIQWLLDCAEGDMDRWIRSRGFEKVLKAGDESCFYRFFTHSAYRGFLSAYSRIMKKHGSLGEYVKTACEGDGVKAIGAICAKFCEEGSCGVIPKDSSSACKRVAMFLRWMARGDSPVDLGLWADFIDRRTIVIPLDTHVLQEAKKLGLIKSTSASMSAAKKLTSALAEVFPDDPVKGDFALFGYAVASPDEKAQG